MLALLLAGSPASAEPPAEALAVLARGVNITNWFRFPASLDPAALRRYLPDPAIADLKRVGLGFVRLAVQPELVANPTGLAAVVGAIDRLQRAGLGVVVGPHSTTWQLETRPADRAALLAFWHILAPTLARFGPKLVFPEILNEPVFASNRDGWIALQATALAEIRHFLPRHTVILTGNDWGSIDGLLGMPGDADPNTVYSIHFYDPSELTSLAAYRAGLDRDALARLPFPFAEPGCAATATSTGDAVTRDLIRYICALHWNAGTLRTRLAAAAEWGRRHHTPVLLGEFGATDRLNPPARLAWLQAVRVAAEQEGMGWALWGYEDSMGFNVPRPPGDHPALDPGVMRALGLPPRGQPINGG